jgi:hypothetical protein
MVEHEMAERKHLAEMLCDRTIGLTDEATLDRRICTIQALVNFCKVQGARQRRRSPPSRDWGLTRDCEPSEAEVPKPRPIPQSCLNTQCIFCLGNLELPAESQFFCFCRPRKAREHVENVYLRHLNVNDPLPCPLCGEIFQEIMHFKNHPWGAIISKGVR